MVSSRKFYEKNGQRFAIINSSYRKSDADAMISLPLTEEQERTYQEGRSGGNTDTQVFNELFPPKKVAGGDDRVVHIDIDILTKTQLVSLIESYMGSKLASLSKMNRADLREMLLSLQRRA